MNFILSTNFHDTSIIADNVIENFTSDVLVTGLVFIYHITTLAEFLDANKIL